MEDDSDFELLLFWKKMKKKTHPNLKSQKCDKFWDSKLLDLQRVSTKLSNLLRKMKPTSQKKICFVVVVEQVYF